MAYPRRGWWWFVISVAGWIWLTLLVLGVIFAGVANYQLSEGWALRVRGVAVTGQVTRLYVTSHSCGTNSRSTCSSYNVDFDFDAAGVMRSDSTTVGSGFYHDLQVGQSLPVRYVKDDPSVNEIEIGTTLTGGVFMTLLALGFLAGGGYGIRQRLQMAGRMIGLRDHGRVMQAVVTARKMSNTKINGAQMWTIQWRDDTGLTGESRLHKELQLPEAGTSVTVYVDPDGVLAPVWEGDCGTR
ncbi:MAG: DUF3592 domain-containing protein [bacterium]